MSLSKLPGTSHDVNISESAQSRKPMVDQKIQESLLNVSEDLNFQMSDEDKTDKVCGILGGLGPEATINFLSGIL